MAEPVFSISTPDPRFDPVKPLKVNGYLFIPAPKDGKRDPCPAPDRVRVSPVMRRLGARM